MSYISEIFQRFDLQNIREFLLHGVESNNTDERPYKMRLDSARKDLIEILYKKFPENNERDEIIDCIDCYSIIVQDVYMEIGLQAGLVLTSQVYKNIIDYTRKKI